MRDEQHYRRMLEENPNAQIHFTLAASMIYAQQNGCCEHQHRGTSEWKTIARRIKLRYGEVLSVDDVHEILRFFSKYT